VGQLAREGTVEKLVDESRRSDDLNFNQQLFDTLRQARKELADSAGVPPYVIFSDKTLVEMATYFPQSRATLLDIHGVGAVKCDRFGAIFLDIIDRFCRQNDIAERPKNPRNALPASPQESRTKKSGKPRHIHIGDIFNSGRSIAEIMDIFNIKQTTVVDHLIKYVNQGLALRCDEIFALSNLPLDQKKVVLRAFDQCGSEYLKPAFDALDGAVSYDDLKLLRLYYLARKNEKSKKSRT
jgi:ATP-dependent DNA helicase RecQ